MEVKDYSKCRKNTPTVYAERKGFIYVKNVFKQYIINRDYKNKPIPTAAAKDGRKPRKCDDTAKVSTKLCVTLILSDWTVSIGDETAELENE